MFKVGQKVIDPESKQFGTVCDVGNFTVLVQFINESEEIWVFDNEIRLLTPLEIIKFRLLKI